MLRLFFILAFCICSFAAHAFHIVGGELFYTCLGGNNYRITLKLYRDCNATGGNVADYGDPEYISIFNSNGGIITQVGLPFPGRDTLEPVIVHPCINFPAHVCVEEAVYESAPVHLPPITGGYNLVYQRCCRNHTISNVISPDQVGSSFVSNMPDNVTCNSSPRFTNFPPIFICVNFPFQFDHSAIDPDGDVLVYEMCNPLLGANQSCPDPSPAGGAIGCPTIPDPPPYAAVPWQTGFNAANPLGGALTLDPQTGHLSVTPSSMGQFVVGVCVKEYRNGVLIGTTRRDFQFNVVNCPAPLANIPSIGTDVQSGIDIFQVNCDDYSVQFINTSVNAVSYKWHFGDPTNPAATSTQFQPNYTYPDTGQYLITLVATNSAGCSDTTQTLVKIYPVLVPDFTFTGFCQYSPVNFTDQSTTAIGTINSWTWWFGDGSSGSGENVSHAYLSPGTYTVTLKTVTDKGCDKTTNKPVNILPAPETYFANTFTCIGDTSHFTNLTTISSGKVHSYAWDFGDGGSSTAENPTHFYSSPGIYQVQLTATSGLGCERKFTQNLQVRPLPVITISGDSIVCEGDTADLTATGGVVYQWEPAAAILNPAISNIEAVIDSQTTFFVYAEDSFGCASTSTFIVDAKPKPALEAGADTSICLNNNDVVQLNAVGTGTFSWSPQAGLSCTGCSNPIASPVDTTAYVVTLTDAEGCRATDTVIVDVLDPNLEPVVPDSVVICTGESVQIAAAGGDGYIWTPATAVSDVNVAAPYFSPTSTSTYHVYVSNYCYTKSDSVVVKVNPLPAADAGPDQNICLGDTFNLNGTGSGTSFHWYPETVVDDPFSANTSAFTDSSITIYVEVLDVNNCSRTDSLYINVFSPPEVTVSEDKTICLGSSVILTASGGAGFAGSDISWNSNDLSCNPCSNPVATPLDTIVYVVTISAIPGCERSDSITISVLHPVNAHISGSESICEGDSIVLTANGGTGFIWSLNGTSTGETGQSITVHPDETTSYSVVVSNGCPGFEDSETITVDVQPLPAIDAGADQNIYRGNSALIAATGTGATYEWSPLDYLEDPFSAATTATPFNTTEYIVTTTDAFGCKKSDTLIIYVEGFDVILAPTAFTPNGDGENDEFYIVKFLNIEKILEFKIFNRWGETVFTGSHLRDKWDGTYKGQPQELGVYVWMIKAVNFDGETVVKTGNLTLVR